MDPVIPLEVAIAELKRWYAAKHGGTGRGQSGDLHFVFRQGECRKLHRGQDLLPSDLATDQG